MPLKKPLPVLAPKRLRNIPRSFAWIDHRMRSEGLLKQMEPNDLGLYLFLTLAADKNGLSCWRLDRIERDMPCFTRNSLWKARDRLAELDLIAYQPWRKGEPDGCYQVLSIVRPNTNVSPDLRDVLSNVFAPLTLEHTNT